MREEKVYQRWEWGGSPGKGHMKGDIGGEVMKLKGARKDLKGRLIGQGLGPLGLQILVGLV